MNPFSELWGQFQSIFPTTLQAIADMLTFLGDHKWAGAIILLTLIVNTLLIPLGIKQFRSTQAMQRLQPEIKRLQKKYKNNKQKLNEEMMELYRREGANPLGGCAPMFLQFPILYAMFFAIRDLEVDNMPFLGLGNLAEAASASPAGWVLLALMTLTSFLSSRQMTVAQSKQQQRLMQLMPLVFVFVMLGFPAGLVLYWATQNLYRYVQNLVMLRQTQPEPPPPETGKGKKNKKKK